MRGEASEGRASFSVLQSVMGGEIKSRNYVPDKGLFQRGSYVPTFLAGIKGLLLCWEGSRPRRGALRSPDYRRWVER